MNLTVGQQVMVYNPFQRADKHDAEIIKLGRVYVTIAWGEGLYRQDQFRIDNGTEKNGGRWRFKTLEQVEADERYDEAKRYLFSVGVDVTYRSPLNPQNVHLNPWIVEELAAIVKNMLAEKPADYESEVANGPQ